VLSRHLQAVAAAEPRLFSPIAAEFGGRIYMNLGRVASHRACATIALEVVLAAVKARRRNAPWKRAPVAKRMSEQNVLR